MKRLFIIMLSLVIVQNSIAQSQTTDYSVPDDSTGYLPIFSVDSAWEYLHQMSESANFWKMADDSLRNDLVRLLNHTREPYDSVRQRLTGMEFREVNVSIHEVVDRDTLQLRWLNDSTFIIDSLGWSMNLMLKEEIRTAKPVDFSTLIQSDTIQDDRGALDSTLSIPNTFKVTVIDTAALESLGVSMYGYSSGVIKPTLELSGQRRSVQISSDSAFLVSTDTSSFWMADDDSPFYRLSGEQQLDSLHYALITLLEHNETRDSTRLLINDIYGNQTPIWITSGSIGSNRFWVKNYKNDSITLWIGNPGLHEISILMEEDIDINRMSVESVGHLPLELEEPDRELAKIEMLKADPVFWEYGLSNAFVFNQAYLSNWTKGGENSLSAMLDINGNAVYNNTDAKTQWINSVRWKYSTLFTEQYGLRKNDDLVEINSQYNKNKWSKVDLSASFYMKNQIDKGYKYPNDSVVVSKFLNPASLTVGLGIDYKPFKHTSINLAPLSYKNTFVLDTAHIDQSAHGVAPDKRARQELGTQLLVLNKFTPMADLTIVNKLRLFSNYLNNPQNVDVDWELLMDKKISWFFTIRLNLHLIYDDDVKFKVFDENDQPIKLPDGNEKKVAKAQFKEFIGLSLLFKI